MTMICFSLIETEMSFLAGSTLLSRRKLNKKITKTKIPLFCHLKAFFLKSMKDLTTFWRSERLSLMRHQKVIIRQITNQESSILIN